MREEAQAERAATTTNKAKGASENPNADKACLYCEAPGHEITGCLMARCVAIMICQVAGIDPRPVRNHIYLLLIDVPKHGTVAN